MGLLRPHSSAAVLVVFCGLLAHLRNLCLLPWAFWELSCCTARVLVLAVRLAFLLCQRQHRLLHMLPTTLSPSWFNSSCLDRRLSPASPAFTMASTGR